MKSKNPVVNLKNNLDQARFELELEKLDHERTIADFNRLQQITCGLILSARTKSISVKGELMDHLDTTAYQIKMDVSEDQKKIVFTAVPQVPAKEEVIVETDKEVSDDTLSI